jgi:O-antigen/teichoic acid export membrane protein
MAEIPPRTRSEQVTHGGALLLIGGMAGRALQYLAQLAMARALPVEQLGLYFLSLTILQALAVAGGLGIDLGLLRYAPRYVAEGRLERLDAALQGALSWCIAAAIVGSSLLITGAGWLAGRVHTPGLAGTLPVVALALPALVLHRVVTQIFQALFRLPSTLILRNLLYPLLFLVVLGPAVFLAPTARAVIAAQGVAAAVPVVLGAWWLHRRHGLLRRTEVSRWAASTEVIRFSAPLLLASVVGFGALWMDSFLTGYYLTPSALGRYGIAFRLSLAGALLLEAFNGALGPAASGLVEKGGGGLEAVYRDVTRLALILYLPVLGAMSIFPETLLGLFGAAYVDGETAAALRILAMGQLVNVGVGGAGMLLVMAGRTWLNLANGLGMAALNLGLCAVLIPRLGITGAALASSAAVTAVNLARLVQLRALLRLGPWDRRLWKPAVALILAGTAAAAVHALGAALCSSLSPTSALPGWVGLATLAAGYGGLMLALGLEPADRALWKRMSERARGGGRQAG